MIGSLKPPTNKMLHFLSAAYSDVAYLYTSVLWGYPESIVACDICEIWYHSRCSGIEDAEALPPLFVCSHRARGRLLRKVVRFFIKGSTAENS